MQHHAPFWLPGGHLQTVWPALGSRRHGGRPPRYARERWQTPDGDFIDVDVLVPAKAETFRPRALLILFHGLEGSSRSHYAEAFAHWAEVQGLAFAVPHFRGCSGEINRAPRAYHSGDHVEIDWILSKFADHAARPRGAPLFAVGVSLGGNALMRWAGESGAAAASRVDALAAICAPLDLAAGGAALGRGLNRRIYTPMFLRTLKPKAMAKLAQFPGLFDPQLLQAARDLYDFDNVFTAPLHGFRDTPDYWARASAKSGLRHVRVPSLVVNPLNDPFIPAASLPGHAEVSPQVTLWQPRHGGHVGFAHGPWPGHLTGLPGAVGGWLLAHAGWSVQRPVAADGSRTAQ